MVCLVRHPFKMAEITIRHFFPKKALDPGADSKV
jgi:hypothetical protein